MTFTINYEDIIKDSLRNAIKKLLMDVSLKGLPGDHHFYILLDICGIQTLKKRQFKKQ
mgnify:CR=1 FL=1